MQVQIQRLRQATNLLFDHLQEMEIEQVELTEDYYWHVDEDELYNMYSEPTAVDVGQLFDDWNEMQALLNGTSEPLAQDLTHLAALLRYIGEKVVR